MYFHTLMAREPGLLRHVTSPEVGEVTHFYAVVCYVLQHPQSMGYTAEALAGARHLLTRHLLGHVTMADVRAEVRRAANGARRILRRLTDAPPRLATRDWPITIDDVLQGDNAEYPHRVATWARSVIRTLDAADAHS